MLLGVYGRITLFRVSWNTPLSSLATISSEQILCSSCTDVHSHQIIFLGRNNTMVFSLGAYNSSYPKQLAYVNGVLCRWAWLLGESVAVSPEISIASVPGWVIHISTPSRIRPPGSSSSCALTVPWWVD